MIRAILVLNNQGKPRLVKFYDEYVIFLHIYDFTLNFSQRISWKILSRKFFIWFHEEMMMFVIFLKVGRKFINWFEILVI